MDVSLWIFWKFSEQLFCRAPLGGQCCMLSCWNVYFYQRLSRRKTRMNKTAKNTRRCLTEQVTSLSYGFEINFSLLCLDLPMSSLLAMGVTQKLLCSCKSVAETSYRYRHFAEMIPKRQTIVSAKLTGLLVKSIIFYSLWNNQRKLPTSCLSVFDHFLWLALERLK